MTKDQIRAIFQAHGFTVKPGQTDLKPYVYEAAEALLKAHAFLTQPPADPTDVFMEEVRAELKRARAKFPGDRIMTIALAEEFGELCKAVLDENAENVRKEAVQTAVMAARVALDGDGSVREWRAAKGLDQIGGAA